MSEISLVEREKIFNQSPVFKGYMSFMKSLIFPEGRFQLSDGGLDYLANGSGTLRDGDFKEPENFKEVENIFASSEKFEELKQSFKQIFARKYGPDKNALSPKQKEALIKWYDLDGQDDYYCKKDGLWQLSRELNSSRHRLASALDQGMAKLREPENFNLLPEEVKNLASTKFHSDEQE